MNKRLRKLTEYHSHTLRKSYYSTDIEKLSKELLEIAEKIKKLEGEKLININTEDLMLTENSKYRHALLPKLLSDAKAIHSSPKLKRYLIDYYLKNRQREGIQRRSYGKRAKHWIANNHLSADYFIHRMYMELGQVMYFSLFNELLNKLKRKWAETKDKLMEIFRQVNSNFRELVKSIANRNSFKQVLNALIVAFFEVFMVVPRKVKSSLLNPRYIGIALVYGAMLVVLSMLTSALVAISTEQDKDNNDKINEETKNFLVSQMYAYGYAIIESIMSVIMFVLPKDYQTERVEELIPLANKLADEIKDKEKLANILDGIMQKLEESYKISGYSWLSTYFEVYSGFGELVTKVKNIEKVSFRITYSISKGLRDAINKAGDGIFNAPKIIKLQEFVKPGEKLIIDPTNFLQSKEENLPGIIEMLAFLTSPGITIKAVVNDGEAEVLLVFNAKKFLEDGEALKISLIESFVSYYLRYYRLLLEDKK